MKLHFIVFYFLLTCGNTLILCQNLGITDSLVLISSAPVKYRINQKDGKTLHGYYSKGYNLNIYGNPNMITFRADCDIDDDWSGATVSGTTQSSNSFESHYSCVFNPHILYGTVIPGNALGQNHFDALKTLGIGAGDLSMTYKINSKGEILDSVIGVVFDYGPQNQPGESSVATVKRLKVINDNNEFVYVIYPNSRKFLIQILGNNDGSNQLNRNPSNDDFINAYMLMLKNCPECTKNSSLSTLFSQKMITFFDNPSPIEKTEGLKQAMNKDRNSNF